MKTARGNDLLGVRKARFEKNVHRHTGVAWAAVQARLEANAAALKSLAAMEASGGDDHAALDARKENKPQGSALARGFRGSLIV